MGRLTGGVLAPVGATLAKETGKTLVSQSARKFLNEAAPTIQGLKGAARSVYNELDNAGVTVSPSAVSKLGGQLQNLVRKEALNKNTPYPQVGSSITSPLSTLHRSRIISATGGGVKCCPISLFFFKFSSCFNM